MFVSRIATKLLLGLAALVVAFTVGYDFGSDREKAKQAESFIQAQADSKDEVLKSQNESIAIEGRVRESNQRIQTIKEEAVQRVANNEPKVVTKVIYRCDNGTSVSEPNSNDIRQETSLDVSRDWTFDNGTVRLLNAARTNDTDSTANVSDVADSTPSTVKVSDLVENDLEVVAKYHELAERHKSLQDFIQSKQQEGMMFCKQDKPSS